MRDVLLVISPSFVMYNVTITRKYARCVGSPIWRDEETGRTAILMSVSQQHMCILLRNCSRALTNRAIAVGYWRNCMASGLSAFEAGGFRFESEVAHSKAWTIS